MGEVAGLTIHVFSFSYKFSGAPEDNSGHGGGFMFDCRGLPNPHHVAELQPHNGREAPIIAFMSGYPEVAAFHERCAALVLASAAVYTERGFERLMVSFGCTGGKHRSVYQAEKLREKLEAEGYRVVLTHQEQARWTVEPTR